MRLRSFYGATMPEAMHLVREALGGEAIIVSTREDGAGIRVTAAIDDAILPSEAVTAKTLSSQSMDAPASPPEAMDIIAQAFVEQNVPSALAERLLAAAAPYTDKEPLLCLGAALETHFSYAPLYDEASTRPLIFVGPPGAGKTLCTAKMATLLTLAKRVPTLIGADTQKAGGMASLAAFARILEIDLIESEDPYAFKDALSLGKNGALPIVDTAGCNPFCEGERQALASLLQVAQADAVLVLPAFMDAYAAVDMAKAFRALGATRLLFTHLDLTRRLGPLLCVAHEAGLPVCAYSASPKAEEALSPLNAATLARRLLHQTSVEEPRRIAAGVKEGGFVSS